MTSRWYWFVANDDIISAADVSDIISAADVSDIISAADVSDIISAADVSDIISAADVSDIISAADVSVYFKRKEEERRSERNVGIGSRHRQFGDYAR